jgi:hypothetical protein
MPGVVFIIGVNEIGANCLNLLHYVFAAGQGNSDHEDYARAAHHNAEDGEAHPQLVALQRVEDHLQGMTQRHHEFSLPHDVGTFTRTLSRLDKRKGDEKKATTIGQRGRKGDCKKDTYLSSKSQARPVAIEWTSLSSS